MHFKRISFLASPILMRSIPHSYLKTTTYLGAREVVQLRTLKTLPLDPGSIPSTQMAAYNSL